MMASSEPQFVLVVDDEPDIRETLSEVVELGGCAAKVASDGAEALDLIERERPCLIILDLMMPRMTGQELIAELRRRPGLASLPVIVSTAVPELAPAGVPVMRKPIDIPQLWAYMQRTCSCARPPSAPATG